MFLNEKNCGQDELEQRAEFSIKNCNIARYSYGGHIFAAVGRTNTIMIHHAFDLKLVRVRVQVWVWGSRSKGLVPVGRTNTICIHHTCDHKQVSQV